MILTEEEAKTKECCGPRRVAISVTCIASYCMAWRWGSKITPPRGRINCYDHFPDRKDFISEPERPDTVPASWIFTPDRPSFWCAHWHEPDDEWEARCEATLQKGFCGLAGRIAA